MDGKINNSRYREPAAMLSDIRGAIETLKRQTSTPGPMEFAPGAILAKYKLQPGLIVALCNKNMMKMLPGKSSRTRKFQFTYGVEPISDKVVQDVYDAYKLIEQRRKAEATANARNAREGNKPVSTVAPVKDKQTTKTPVKNGKSSVIGSSVDHYSSQLKKSPFENIRGTIFGLKQLTYMRFLPLRKSSEVLIDKRYTINNVELIAFSTDKSKLIISFYMSPLNKDFQPDESTIVGKLEMDNVVLALQDKTLDSTKTGAIEITTVPVKDPYNLKDY